MQIRERIIKALKGQTLFQEDELRSIIDFEWEQLSKIMSSGKEAVQSELKKTLKAHGKTKKRWVDKERDDNSSFSREMEDVFSVFARENGIKAFQEVYKAKDFHAYRTKQIEELEAWANNEETLCFQFKYFENKMNWQRDTAIKTDIKVLCLREILSDDNMENQKPVVSQLNAWVVAVDPTSRIAFPEIEDNGKIRTLTISLPGGTSIRQELTIEEAKGDVYASQMVQKLMNDWDLSLLRFVLHKLAEQKYRDSDITTTRREILDFMKESLNGRNYEMVEASIRKLIALTIFINSPSNNFSLRFLESYNLTNKGNQETLNISLNKDVYTQALNGKITSMYKDVIDSLSGAAAAIIYRLQRLRIQKHYQKESPIVRVDFNFFKTILIFNSQRRDRMSKSIENSLDEIVGVGVTLKHYTKITDGLYELEFLPLSPSEMNDLGTFNTNAEHLIFPVKSDIIE